MAYLAGSSNSASSAVASSKTCRATTGTKPSLTISGGMGFTEKLAIHFRMTAASYNHDVFIDTKPYQRKATLGIITGEARYELNHHRIAPFLAGGFDGLQFSNISTTIPAPLHDSSFLTSTCARDGNPRA